MNCASCYQNNDHFPAIRLCWPSVQKFQSFFFSINKWDKMFKNGPSEICRRELLKNLGWYGLLFNFFKGCLQQILVGLFLNTSSYILYKKEKDQENVIIADKKV